MKLADILERYTFLELPAVDWWEIYISIFSNCWDSGELSLSFWVTCLSTGPGQCPVQIWSTLIRGLDPDFTKQVRVPVRVRVRILPLAQDIRKIVKMMPGSSLLRLLSLF